MYKYINSFDKIKSFSDYYLPDKCVVNGITIHIFKTNSSNTVTTL